VIFDTGGGDTWFPDVTCGDDCGDLTLYNGGDSQTFHDVQVPFSVNYGDGDFAKGGWTAGNK
jgi:hypothetical protein